jgi:hypothetical protein
MVTAISGGALRFVTFVKVNPTDRNAILSDFSFFIDKKTRNRAGAPSITGKISIFAL